MKNDPRALSKKQQADLDFEISFYEKLLLDNPNLTDALMPLGDDYTKRGLYEKGLEVDLKLAKLMPLDPTVYYNLACSYSLLQNVDSAINALEKSIKFGYNDFKWMQKDPDLEAIRNNNRFLGLIRRTLNGQSLHKA